MSESEGKGLKSTMAPAFSADKWVWLITPSSKEVCSQAQAGCVAAEALELKPSLGGELVATTEKVNFSLNLNLAFKRHSILSRGYPFYKGL